MASMITEIKIKHELRPCIITNSKGEEKRALFHRWEQYTDVITPSLMIGGHPGGQIAEVYGIVEDENGNVIRCKAMNIRFIDNKHRDYCFKEIGNELEKADYLESKRKKTRGKPSKQTVVRKWQEENPHKNKSDCQRETGISWVTINKWWI